MKKTAGLIGVVIVTGAMYALLDWGSTALAFLATPDRPTGFPRWARPALDWGEPAVVVLQLLLAYWLVRRPWPEKLGKRILLFAVVVVVLNVRMFDLLRLVSSLAWARYVAFTDLLTLTVLFLTALFVATGVDWMSGKSQA